MVSDALTLTVTAPGATQVKLIYKPVTAAKRHLEMATLTASTAGRKLPLTDAAEPKPEA